MLVAPAVGEPLAEPGAPDLTAKLGLEAAARMRVPVVTARSMLRSSTCMSACRERARAATNFMAAYVVRA